MLVETYAVGAPLWGAPYHVEVNPKDLITILLLGIATAVVSITLSKAVIFKKMRGWLKPRSSFFWHLLCCPFCTSMWVSPAWTAVYLPRPLATWLWPVDLALSALVIVGLCALMCGFIYKTIGWIAQGDECQEEEEG